MLMLKDFFFKFIILMIKKIKYNNELKLILNKATVIKSVIY